MPRSRSEFNINSAQHLASNQAVARALDALPHSLSATVAPIRAAVPNELVQDSFALAAADPSIVVQPLAQLKKLLENDENEAADFVLDARTNLSKVLTKKSTLSSDTSTKLLKRTRSDLFRGLTLGFL